ncbi:twin-arginine translocation signal domain-containing protein [Azospirillum sp. A26]|uniref:twin-arginine translocation signal domain-containing protein n=1 Tax=Azospirillum sp. A26 TaxID=3160607 RepID=UPI0036707398
MTAKDSIHHKGTGDAMTRRGFLMGSTAIAVGAALIGAPVATKAATSALPQTVKPIVFGRVLNAEPTFTIDHFGKLRGSIEGVVKWEAVYDGGVKLARVDRDPRPGEWTVDEGNIVLGGMPVFTVLADVEGHPAPMSMLQSLQLPTDGTAGIRLYEVTA